MRGRGYWIPKSLSPESFRELAQQMMPQRVSFLQGGCRGAGQRLPRCLPDSIKAKSALDSASPRASVAESTPARGRTPDLSILVDWDSSKLDTKGCPIEPSAVN
eukprot:1513108-Amphidinium_carterae.1